MTMGEHIAALRAAQRLSQGELAEKLNVSRQSVSKWENDTSIPELEKLLQLSDLFGVTLDELVRPGHTAVPPEPAPTPAQIVVHKGPGTQQIIGFILLALGLLCCILALFTGGGLLIPGCYMILCSVLCLALRRHAGLVIGWLTLAAAVLLGPYVVGVSLLVAVGSWLCLAVLIFFTVRAVRKRNEK